MEGKLTRHGEGWALVLDPKLLSEMHFDPETPLEVTTDGQSLIVSPVPDPARRARFETALAETNRRYGQALQNLA